MHVAVSGQSKINMNITSFRLTFIMLNTSHGALHDVVCKCIQQSYGVTRTPVHRSVLVSRRKVTGFG